MFFIESYDVVIESCDVHGIKRFVCNPYDVNEMHNILMGQVGCFAPH